MSSAVVIPGGAPTLVLEPVAGAVGVIDSEPLLVPAGSRSKVSPGLAAIHRAPHVIEERAQKAKVEKMADVIRRQDRVAPKNVVLQDAGERP